MYILSFAAITCNLHNDREQKEDTRALAGLVFLKEKSSLCIWLMECSLEGFDPICMYL